MQRRDFKGNVWRHLLADAIEKNCGYSSGYHDRAALSWNVSVDGYIPDYWGTLIKEIIADPDSDISEAEINEIDPAKFLSLKETWEEDQHQFRMWDWVVEDMQRDLLDGDSYRSLSPEIAARYGLPGSEAKLHSGTRYDKEHKYRAGAWNHCLYFSVGWSFMGRQGKHLCLGSFEGRDLNMRADALAEFIREDDQGSYTNEWCQKLLAFIHECDLMFTTEKVRDEFRYQLRYRLVQELGEALEDTRKEAKEAAQVQEWNERDVVTRSQ